MDPSTAHKSDLIFSRFSLSTRAVWLSLGAMAVAALAWNGFGSMYVLFSVLLFPIWGTANTRWERFCVGLSYHLTACIQIVVSGHAFFTSHSLPASILLWIAIAILLSIPWGLCNRKTSFVLLLITIIPPYSYIAIASPLTAAGILYPGTGWIGIILTILLAMLLSWHEFGPSLILLLVSCGINWLYQGPHAIPGWKSVNTHFSPSTDMVSDWQLDQRIQSLVSQSETGVSVYPESIINNWSRSRAAFWRSTLRTIKSKDVLIGAERIPTSNLKLHENGILYIHNGSGQFFPQRVPVPVGMWGRDFIRSGDAPATFQVGKEVVAPLICWEQLLVMPVLESFAQTPRPSVIVGVSNLHWATGTVIDRAQVDCLRSWSRLFHTPFVRGVNI